MRVESLAYCSSATTPARDAIVDVSVFEQVKADMTNSAFLIFVDSGLFDRAVLVVFCLIAGLGRYQ